MGKPVVEHVDTSGEDKVLKKEAIFRLRIVFLFTSLDKCCGDGLFPSDNGTCIFWGIYWSQYIFSGFIEVIFQRWVLCSVNTNDMKTDTI